MENDYKVELGCGRSKAPGFIGIDRFPLPGVDLVADLNDTWPLEDDSVDVVFASHSLEHLDDLPHVMDEMYRVCRHKALVLILAPYYFTFTNIANHYHKHVFDEDTLRFFSLDPAPDIDPEEYYCPHASFWGLGRSDNSAFSLEFTTLHMEFFYYQQYRHLSPQVKRRLRRSMLNVCDQIYYVAAVNKSSVPFSDEERQALLNKAEKVEPPIIETMRKRDLKIAPQIPTVLGDIMEPVRNSVDDARKRLEDVALQLQQETEGTELALQDVRAELTELKQSRESMEPRLVELERSKECMEPRLVELEQSYCKAKTDLQVLETGISHMQARLAQRVDTISYKAFQLGQQQKRLREEDRRLYQRLAQTRDEQRYLRQALVELTKAQEHSDRRHRYFSLFRKGQDLFSSLQCPANRRFMDGVILGCSDFHKDSLLTISNIIPFHTYFEYPIIGFGKSLHCFLFANPGAKLFVELVQDDQILYQRVLELSKEGDIEIPLCKIGGRMGVRFRARDNSSLIRVLEVTNRRLFIAAQRSLAYYFED